MVQHHGGGCVWKEFMLTASLLGWWTVQQAWAELLIEKIPSLPEEDQNVLLSVHGVPSAIKDYNWYQGEEPDGSTMLFSYFPGLPRPQRNGNAMRNRDIIGFPNGSLLLRGAHPKDSDIYQVGITLSPNWIMRAMTELRVTGKNWTTSHVHKLHPQSPKNDGSSFMNAGIIAAIVIGCLGFGALVLGSGLAYLVMTRGWRMRPGTETVKPGLEDICRNNKVDIDRSISLAPSSLNPDGSNIYEVIHSPNMLISPASDIRSMGPNLTPALPQTRNDETESHRYEELMDPDPAPYCQLTPTA